MPHNYTTPHLSIEARLRIWAEGRRCPYCGSGNTQVYKEVAIVGMDCNNLPITTTTKVQYTCHECGAVNPFSGPVVQRVVRG